MADETMEYPTQDVLDAIEEGAEGAPDDFNPDEKEGEA